MSTAAEAKARPQARLPWRSEAMANLGLALPIAIAFLAEMATVFVDNVMVGRLGSPELAAGGLGATLLFSPLLLGMGVLGGVAAVGAQAHGAGDQEKLSAVARQGLRLAIMLSLPCGGVLLGFALLLPHLGYDPATVEMVQGLLLWGLPGVPAFLAFNALRNFVTAIGRPRVVTVVAVLAVGVTAIANYLFIYGNFGMPRLGVAGVGVSGSIGSWAQFLAVAVYIGGNASFRRYRVFSRTSKADGVLREILHVGWPIAGAYMFENGLFVVTALLIALFGAAALAANVIVNGLCAFTFMIPYAIGQAATVRVGHAMGAGRPAGARWSGYVALHLGAIWMSLTAVLFLVLPKQLVGLYIDIGDPANAPTVAIALLLLPIAALFQIFDGTQAVAVGALRGLKDTRQPMVICFIGYWLIGITSGSAIGFGLGLGAVGLWLGLAIGLAATAILLTLRFRQRASQLLA
jgi:MATE family multidrug resistance protein